MENTTPNAYDYLIAAGIAVESHESDLYTPNTIEARNIFDMLGVKYSVFRDQSGEFWLDAPFQFMPYWRKRSRA